jgi:hypothetical protein
MKKIIVLFAFALISILNFTSCSSEDDSSTSSSIVGKWNFSKISTTINGVTSPEMDYDDNELGCPKDFVEFKTGGIYTEGDYSGSTCLLDSSAGTWVQSGSNITITQGTDVFTAEVVSVTSTTLKVKATETDSGVTITINITFTKA